VQLLLDSGLKQHELAVITPYNGQVNLLREVLSERSDVEIGTVDGFQVVTEW